MTKYNFSGEHTYNGDIFSITGDIALEEILNDDFHGAKLRGRIYGHLGAEEYALLEGKIEYVKPSMEMAFDVFLCGEKTKFATYQIIKSSFKGKEFEGKYSGSFIQPKYSESEVGGVKIVDRNTRDGILGLVNMTIKKA
jgi:hypothetical protein